MLCFLPEVMVHAIGYIHHNIKKFKETFLEKELRKQSHGMVAWIPQPTFDFVPSQDFPRKLAPRYFFTRVSFLNLGSSYIFGCVPFNRLLTSKWTGSTTSPFCFCFLHSPWPQKPLPSLQQPWFGSQELILMVRLKLHNLPTRKSSRRCTRKLRCLRVEASVWAPFPVK